LFENRVKGGAGHLWHRGQNLKSCHNASFFSKTLFEASMHQILGENFCLFSAPQNFASSAHRKKHDFTVQLTYGQLKKTIISACKKNCLLSLPQAKKKWFLSYFLSPARRATGEKVSNLSSPQAKNVAF